MDYCGVEICCPRCHADLEWGIGGSRLKCVGCGHVFPVVGAVPDLRVFSDPYIPAEADRAKGEVLAAYVQGTQSFADLIDFYYGNTSVVPAHHARMYKAGLLGAEAKAEAALEAWGIQPGDALLDVGCGTAPLLVAARSRFRTVVGVDIAFRWLQVARKRLIEAGIEAPLICACAEALPFPAGAFDVVTADSTVELLRDSDLGLREMRRVSTAGATLNLATPNRFSIGPDPHTGAWGGSWWPDRLVRWYMKRRNAIPPVRRLLTAGSAREAVRSAGFQDVRVFLPTFPDAQFADAPAPVRWGLKAYRRLSLLPGGAALLRLVGPRLLLTGRVPE